MLRHGVGFPSSPQLRYREKGSVRVGLLLLICLLLLLLLLACVCVCLKGGVIVTFLGCVPRTVGLFSEGL